VKRIVGLLVLWIAVALSLAGADVGPRRALLASQIPGWVRASYGVFGTMPDLALQFANGRGWQRGLGQGSARSFLTVSRASTAYEDDTSGNWYQFASGLLRVTNKGALIEESRTDSIRNNSMQGAVAGTPGTLPTNWSLANNVGLTTSVVGTGTENGIDYIDLRFSGTASGAGVVGPGFETATAISASNAQVWAQSLFLSLTAGSTSNITSFTLGVDENTSGGAFVRQDTTTLSNPTSGALSGKRVSQVVTLSGGGTVGAVNPWLRANVTGAGAVDITIRVGWPQLELGASVTSPIRTTSAAATRAADGPAAIVLPFGSAYSIYFAGTPTAPVTYGTDQVAVQISDGSNNNRFRGTRKLTTAVAQAGSSSGGSATNLSSVATWAQGAAGKSAMADANADQALSFNGATIVTGSGTLPIGVTSVFIGAQSSGGAASWNGYLTDVAVWANTRLPNAGLVTGATP
jgi:hypothetical protein